MIIAYFFIIVLSYKYLSLNEAQRFQLIIINYLIDTDKVATSFFKRLVN